ncbi:unnamed protein product [Dovyalis caffra]|uniref:Uncharacterized protein n=1 Tax=Dovyalis caffra TaxID=77055 RepID=A0AAV1SN80_9ROSI|nr:unnamed protein product [Dovyalis caffra]
MPGRRREAQMQLGESDVLEGPENATAPNYAIAASMVFPSKRLMWQVCLGFPDSFAGYNRAMSEVRETCFLFWSSGNIGEQALSNVPYSITVNTFLH